MSIWVGRYAIVGGEVREHGPWLVEAHRVRDDEVVQLVVLAEPADDRSAEFCSEVANAVADLFAQESLSITGGLLRAMQQAHANLSEWNRRSLREHQIAIGLTAVAIRGNEATLAQAGPAVAFVATTAGVRRFATEGEPAERPLGASEPVEPQFLSTPIGGSQILLLTSNVEVEIGTEGIEESLAAGPERTLAELFLRTRHMPDVTAALVADLDIPEGPPEGRGGGAAPPAERPPGGGRTLAGGAPSDAPTAEVSSDAVAAARDEPQPPPRPRPVVPPEAPARAELPSSAPRSREAAGRTGSALPSGGPMPVLRRPRVGVHGPGSGDRPLSRLPWRSLALAAGIIAVIVVAALALLPPLLDKDRDRELDEALAAAEQHMLLAERALAGDDVTTRRTELDLALEEIERARSIAPEAERVVQVERTVSAALAELDAVVEVSDLRRLISFEGVLTAPLGPADLVAGGGTLWLLDDERGRVFALDPAGRSEPIEMYRAGDEYEGAIAALPLAAAWEPASGRLLVLDENRTLFALAAGREPEVLPLRDADELQSVQAIATYTSNLYILDAAAGDVWRYLPAGVGFDSERSSLLGGQRLDGAEDLAVDGDVFVLSSGALHRYAMGQEQQPLLEGIDTPPETVAGLVEDAGLGVLYVGDRGGRRIVASDREGRFLHQYRHAEFFDLRGLALGEGGTTLYVLTGSGVLSFDPLAN